MPVDRQIDTSYDEQPYQNEEAYQIGEAFQTHTTDHVQQKDPPE